MTTSTRQLFYEFLFTTGSASAVLGEIGSSQSSSATPGAKVIFVFFLFPWPSGASNIFFRECSGAAIAVPISNPVAKWVGTTIVDPLQFNFVKKLIGLFTRHSGLGRKPAF
jgi:hypothetical protein